MDEDHELQEALKGLERTEELTRKRLRSEQSKPPPQEEPPE